MAPVWRSSQPAVSKSGSAIVGIDGGDLGRGVSSMPAPKSTTDDILVNLELPKKLSSTTSKWVTCSRSRSSTPFPPCQTRPT